MRIAEVVKRFGGVCEGDEAIEITGVNGLDLAGPGDTTFALDEQALAEAEAREVACVLVPHEMRRSSVTLLRCDSPRRYAVELMTFLRPEPLPGPGIHPSAILEAGSTVAEDASIGPHVTVGTGCQIGPSAVLMACVTVGRDCEIGEETIIHPNVTLYPRTRIGARVRIHAGAVLGGDGFGYFPEGGQLYKWPHVGNVVVEDDVEIGANACIDRARFKTTLIGRGAKIDNLVQVAHNCHIGPGAILAAHTGISGSVTLGAQVVCGGQVGIADHATIGAGARIGAQSGLKGEVPPKSDMFGSPARPARQAMQEMALLRYLNENRAILRKLIKSAEARGR
jgi:UDP-3-O-[3-hydroxymyristoyl] glucosamine N-acyltransferase